MDETPSSTPEPSGAVDEASLYDLPVGGGRDRARDWALALASQGIEARIEVAGRGLVLRMHASDAAAARTILAAYLRENPAADRDDAGAGQPAASARPMSGIGLPVGGVLLAIFALTGDRGAGHVFFDLGSAQADRILAGEWWRCVTALGLHADLAHVAGNVFFGLYFMGAVGRALGPGIGAAAVLCSGALGNALNAWAHGAGHDSVGASTAVFGAVGLLVGLALVERRRSGQRGARLWLPLAAGLALLGFLGTSGERVDLWAHLYGLLVGSVLGVALGPLEPAPPGRWVQGLVGLLAFALVVASVTLALPREEPHPGPGGAPPVEGEESMR